MPKQNLPKPTLTDGYRYIGNQLKHGWKQYGGKVMTVAGTTGLFLTGVHACRKTYKIHDRLQENGRKISEAKAYLDGENKLVHAWRVTKTFASCAAKTSALYAVDAVAGGLSAYAISKGWHQEHQNYQQAAAMVGVVMADFMNYRNNVISEHGIDADRRYLTTKRNKAVSISPEKGQTVESTPTGEEHILELDENSLRILYSRETTPSVWSDSLVLRKAHLDDITQRLTMDLIYGGSYTVNDVRREFYGRKGDIGEGGLYGRIWDPGDPEHPERGALVNLHYEEDEDFLSGRTDYCWIIIDIDNEPLFELLKKKHDRELAKSL